MQRDGLNLKIITSTPDPAVRRAASGPEPVRPPRTYTVLRLENVKAQTAEDLAIFDRWLVFCRVPAYRIRTSRDRIRLLVAHDGSLAEVEWALGQKHFRGPRLTWVHELWQAPR